MLGTLARQLLANAMKSQGVKLIAKDANNTGKDDIAGQVLKSMGGVVEKIEFDVNKISNVKTLRNIVTALRAAADEIEETLELSTDPA